MSTSFRLYLHRIRYLVWLDSARAREIAIGICG